MWNIKLPNSFPIVTIKTVGDMVNQNQPPLVILLLSILNPLLSLLGYAKFEISFYFRQNPSTGIVV